MKTLVRVDGRRVIAYDELGAGDPLVCLPGGPGFSGEQVGDLGGLDRHRRLVRADLRGSGESDPPEHGTWSFAEYVPDLDLLLDTLGVESVDLHGHAHGGLVAVAYATARPHRVRSLVLDSVPVRTIEAIDREGFTEVSDYFHLHNERVKRFIDANLGRIYEPAFIWFWENEVFADFPAMLAACPARTLLVTGDDDHMAGETPTAVVADRMPRGKLAVIPEAGHFPWVDQPEAFCRVVLDFLADAGSSAEADHRSVSSPRSR
jgi:pimeloyl-ACP methyl ester carboxylesterase